MKKRYVGPSRTVQQLIDSIMAEGTKHKAKEAADEFFRKWGASLGVDTEELKKKSEPEYAKVWTASQPGGLTPADTINLATDDKRL